MERRDFLANVGLGTLGLAALGGSSAQAQEADKPADCADKPTDSAGSGSGDLYGRPENITWEQRADGGWDGTIEMYDQSRKRVTKRRIASASTMPATPMWIGYVVESVPAKPVSEGDTSARAAMRSHGHDIVWVKDARGVIRRFATLEECQAALNQRYREHWYGRK